MTDEQTNSPEETKIIYYIDDEETPYLTKINKPPNTVTLGDFKTLLNKPNYKYFFKSMDEHFGVVKEEITDDKKNLPCINGRVVSYLVCSEGSTVSSDHNSHNVDHTEPGIRSAGIGDSRPPSFHGQSGHPHPRHNFNHALNRAPTDSDTLCDTCTDTDSVYSLNRDRVPPLKNIRSYRPGIRAHSMDPPGSKVHSDFDSSTNFDSEDELNSRMSTLTDNTVNSSNYRSRLHQRYRRNPISKASSYSSMTDSNLSLNILTVTLDMGSANFLGISIVGQSNDGGDGGIYIGSIMKDGAVAKDGRIEPGDMILEANGISFENMSNDDAVLTLREQVQKPGPLTLVVAKSWISNPKNYFTVPAQEPVRPIDPRAWVIHTTAMTAGGASDTDNHSGIVAGGPVVPGWFPQPGMSVAPSSIRAPSMATMSSLAPGASASAFAAGMMGGSGLPIVNESKHGMTSQQQGGGGGSVVTASSSLPESERYLETPLTVNSDFVQIVQALTRADSGLEIRNRLWLKITLPNAFIGSDLVNWLYKNVEGFTDRRDARKYASHLLKLGFIRHTVNKISFSEQCYYVFGERARNLPEKPHWVDVDSVSEVDARELQQQQQQQQHSHQPPPASYFNFPPDYANPSNTTNGGSSQYSSLPAIYQQDSEALRRRRSRSSSGSSSSSSVSHVSNERAVLPPPPN